MMKQLRYILFLFAMILAAQLCYAQTTQLTVISNQKGSPADMKKAELKSIFRGEKQRWKNGNKIVIALMKTNTAAGQTVCRNVYDMSGDEVKKFWLALVFQGKAEAPVFFNTISELQAYVSENPGAIGIIDQSPSVTGVQVVSIDGKKTF
jgi:ABC-type phosphate transport system substrate-binding protein